jgi:hypothetical protein
MAILLLVSIPASAQGTANISRHVVSGGGRASGNLVGAIGQPVAGMVENLCSGFWCPGTIVAQIGSAVLSYRITFGQAAIMAASIVWLAAIGARWVYDSAHEHWRPA